MFEERKEKQRGKKRKSRMNPSLGGGDQHLFSSGSLFLSKIRVLRRRTKNS